MRPQEQQATAAGQAVFNRKSPSVLTAMLSRLTMQADSRVSYIAIAAQQMLVTADDIFCGGVYGNVVVSQTTERVEDQVLKGHVSLSTVAQVGQRHT